MASLNEILEFEQRRETDSDWRRIYLHKDGKFYRAYQVSAWLYSCAINEYKVTHRRFKSVPESVLYWSFRWRVGPLTDYPQFTHSPKLKKP